MRTSRLVKVVRKCLGQDPGGGVVAVSGGADSVALLRALHEAGSANLTVAHLNHQLRGDESDIDEQFVRNLTASLGLAFRSVRINVLKEAAGANLEATARRIRYEWLRTVAEEGGAAWIATGHTADDQAETVLHRLIRGTGLQGLRGIAERNPPVIRPLLTVTRAEILDYLANLGQPFRTDSSNADPRFTRNRIRAELLPLMKSFNPEAVAVLGRLAEQADEAHSFIESQAREFLQRIEKPRAGDVIVLDRRELLVAMALLRREAFRLIWEREGWPMGEMSFDHWERAADLTDCDFPEGVGMRVRERVVQLGRHI
ncbi:MAG TPA: tRNA lysidine(34) synthetase TilS [Urbifossiella sp.]